jgi:hypothetical protein
MLVRITNDCDMGCTHCFADAKPGGEFMTMETYAQVIDFIIWSRFPMIMLTGGEPTHHPDILAMIDIAVKANFQPLLLSNGTFLEKPKLKDAILNSYAKIQITNDPRFYPRRVPVIEHSRVTYETHIRMVSPFGRAITNNIPTNRKSPTCFNIRSLCRTMGDFREALFSHHLNGKFCTPSINIDGSITAGETPFCSVIGTVLDREELTEKLYSLKCNKCGLLNGLEMKFKRAIGETKE